MTFSLRSTRIISGFILSLITTSALGSEVNTTNHFMTGLNTLANNCKTIGWNVLSGIGIGIVNVTNTLVPASDMFKKGMENPKSAICAAAFATYAGYTIKSSSKLAFDFKKAHNFVNPDKTVKTGSERIGLLLQDCYDNMLVTLHTKRPNYYNAKNIAFAQIYGITLIANETNEDFLLRVIGKENDDLNEYRVLIAKYLHNSSLLPRILYKAPILVEQAQKNLIAQGRLKSFDTYGDLNESQMNLIEEEVKRLNSAFVIPNKISHYDSNDSDSIDEYDYYNPSHLSKIKNGLKHSAQTIGTVLVKLPKAFANGLTILTKATNKFLVNLVYTKEQKAQWDYWLLCKQKAALERLATEIAEQKLNRQ